MQPRRAYRSGRGNGEKEGAALARPALHPDDTAVCLDGELAEGQAQSRGHLAPGLAVLHLAELFEYAVERLGRDALAGVTDAEQQGIVARLGRGRDGAPGRRELDGIPQQVDQRPAQGSVLI